jgi:O-methyltransferase domain
VDAIQKWSHKGNGVTVNSIEVRGELQGLMEDEEPSHTGWNLANGTEEHLYSFLNHDKRRGKQFAESMSFFHAQPGFEFEHLTRVFDWEGKVGQGGLVVDIGGNQGEVSLAVARANPGMRFVVQDLEAAIKSRETQGLQGSKNDLEKPLPDVQFMVHDFFEPQPVKGADLYLLRWILHNWPDAYAVKIIQNLISALKRGARILVVEHVMPEPRVLGRYAERQARYREITPY